MKSEIRITHNEEEYSAYIEISKGMVTVSIPTLGSKSATESGNNEVLAKIMLQELVNEAEGKGWE